MDRPFARAPGATIAVDVAGVHDRSHDQKVISQAPVSVRSTYGGSKFFQQHNPSFMETGGRPQISFP